MRGLGGGKWGGGNATLHHDILILTLQMLILLHRPTTRNPGSKNV